MTERLAEIMAERRALEVRQAWDTVLRTREGRLVIWSILERCYPFAQTHHGNEMDGWRAGQREVGLMILNERIFPHDVGTFAAMQTEHAELMDRIQLAAEQQAEREQADE
ncbi:hypothetical protein JWJ88_17335 [Paracoccus methylovorus]|uniref:Bbp19-like phage domain-containing protein n=1 Tax=Paracoccus methylovorus TaxID=2812658 RepID=A0ABX7JN32_9RHOB|nr:hypothetical protein [Paracoccus methylovorus]QRZ14728.1 hypothetical protein JWJ88_17335 [Paracoccus methylovorus]